VTIYKQRMRNPSIVGHCTEPTVNHAGPEPQPRNLRYNRTCDHACVDGLLWRLLLLHAFGRSGSRAATLPAAHVLCLLLPEVPLRLAEDVVIHEMDYCTAGRHIRLFDCDVTLVVSHAWEVPLSGAVPARNNVTCYFMRK
jgi:hypothetical protein